MAVEIGSKLPELSNDVILNIKLVKVAVITRPNHELQVVQNDMLYIICIHSPYQRLKQIYMYIITASIFNGLIPNCYKIALN